MKSIFYKTSIAQLVFENNANSIEILALLIMLFRSKAKLRNLVLRPAVGCTS